MAGHSHSSNIQVRKNAQDKARGKLFSKLMKEIYVSVKLGGPDPDSNAKLRAAISKAKQNSVPKDRISKAISKGSQPAGGANFEELVFEGYGPEGIAVMALCLTDNRNRTAGEIRFAFAKGGGNMGASGCVAYMFQKKGVITVTAEDEDELMMLALDAGAEDIRSVDEGFEVITTETAFESCLDVLKSAEVDIVMSDIQYIPDNRTTPSAEARKSFQKLLELLDASDDVQSVEHNAILDD